MKRLAVVALIAAVVVAGLVYHFRRADYSVIVELNPAMSRHTGSYFADLEFDPAEFERAKCQAEHIWVQKHSANWIYSLLQWEVYRTPASFYFLTLSGKPGSSTDQLPEFHSPADGRTAACTGGPGAAGESGCLRDIGTRLPDQLTLICPNGEVTGRVRRLDQTR